MRQTPDQAFILFLMTVFSIGMAGLILAVYKNRPVHRVIGGALVCVAVILAIRYNDVLNALFDSGIFRH